MHQGLLHLIVSRSSWRLFLLQSLVIGYEGSGQKANGIHVLDASNTAFPVFAFLFPMHACLDGYVMYKGILLWVSIQYILRLHDVYAWLEGWKDKEKWNGRKGNTILGVWFTGDIFLYSGMIPRRAELYDSIWAGTFVRNR
ncbi:hypothetical protein EYC84_010143 [Monilinia fructicola]|uniref:Uncharacterized protein n=1 Tax=Monilinia fructicola TaxID=38448 RepID=A0A5M9JBT6_MONFR|nr:hypothetical protein EYC84_010143 [Monilinia fructicola]